MGEEKGSQTHLHDLPEVILSNILSLVDGTRTRNAISLVCQRWRHLERSTRTSITLRGNVRHLFLLPTSFSSVTRLDISLLSPWGYSFHQLPHHHHHHNNNNHPAAADYHVVASCLCRAFPNVTSLTVYARTPSMLQALAPHWPRLRHVKLVRWHQRPSCLPGSDFVTLLHGCPSLSSLDLSAFYCWTEDLPAALQAQPALPPAASSLTNLNLLSLPSVDGFKSLELLAISSACPNLRQFHAPCGFDPRFHDFVGDETLIRFASNCKQLSTLHLVDHSALSAPRAGPRGEGGSNTPDDARITQLGLENLFASLPMLKDLVLDVCHNVRDAGPALEALNHRCPRIKALKLGQFHGVCTAAALHLDGVAVCGGLTSLSLKNCADLTDSSLVTIARGCSRLARFEIQGCKMVTQAGLRKLASMLRSTLVDVSISCCKHLDAGGSLRAMEAIRDRIERLHIDCIWFLDGQPELLIPENGRNTASYSRIDDCDEVNVENGDNLKNKKCKFSEEHTGLGFDFLASESEFWCRTWKKLRYLSLWLPVGELLTPLAEAGLESCPELEEICIKVEGDCRMCLMPNQTFGLDSLINYPRLSKMKLDCADAIGYVLTAPEGQIDLSLWDRFYLNGIRELNLTELDYWPPQDKDVNQRSLSLPAVGLLSECATLRKLFIHGTTHEHFMGFLVNIPNLRDVQLKEDYYPAPENDTSTEMRVDSCSRFNDALNSRRIPD